MQGAVAEPEAAWISEVEWHCGLADAEQRRRAAWSEPQTAFVQIPLMAAFALCREWVMSDSPQWGWSDNPRYWFAVRSDRSNSARARWKAALVRFARLTVVDFYTCNQDCGDHPGRVGRHHSSRDIPDRS
jgi:hypothetical protein